MSGEGNIMLHRFDIRTEPRMAEILDANVQDGGWVFCTWGRSHDDRFVQEVGSVDGQGLAEMLVTDRPDRGPLLDVSEFRDRFYNEMRLVGVMRGRGFLLRDHLVECGVDEVGLGDRLVLADETGETVETVSPIRRKAGSWERLYLPL